MFLMFCAGVVAMCAAVLHALEDNRCAVLFAISSVVLIIAAV
jgi:hypothetical protein